MYRPSPTTPRGRLTRTALACTTFSFAAVAVTGCAADTGQELCTSTARCFTVVAVGRQTGQTLQRSPMPDSDYTVVSYTSKTGAAPIDIASAEADSVAALAAKQHVNGGDHLLVVDQVTSVETSGPLKEGRLYYYRITRDSATRLHPRKAVSPDSATVIRPFGAASH